MSRYSCPFQVLQPSLYFAHRTVTQPNLLAFIQDGSFRARDCVHGRDRVRDANDIIHHQRRLQHPAHGAKRFKNDNPNHRELKQLEPEETQKAKVCEGDAFDSWRSCERSSV